MSEHQPQSSNSSKKGVSVPRSSEEWSTFLSSYGKGEHVGSNFPVGPPNQSDPSDSEHIVGRLYRTSHSSSHLIQSTPPSSLSGESIPTHLNNHHAGKRILAQGETSLPSREGSSRQHASSTPMQSDPGFSNQDPNIPNIPAEMLQQENYFSNNQDLATRKKVQKLSLNNISQLNREVEQAKMKALDQERSNQPGVSSDQVMDPRSPISEVQLIPLKTPSDESSPSDLEHPHHIPRGLTQKETHLGGQRQYRSPKRESPDSVFVEAENDDSCDDLSQEIMFDEAADFQMIREFYSAHGYLPAPRQQADVARKRMRAVRRLGFDTPTAQHRQLLDRFTRLAVLTLRCRGAFVSTISTDRITFLTDVGLGLEATDLTAAFCTHTVLGTGEVCLVVPNTAEDWRFRGNPLSKINGGKISFYAGAPLRIGSGTKAALIGTLCVFDETQQEFGEREQKILLDLADCIVSEWELLHAKRSSEENGKLHQVSVDFLRRSLKHRPKERAGSSDPKASGLDGSSSGKRNEGADEHQSEESIDIYDEACVEIRTALDAYAVAVVDMSQFHLFYPTYQNTSYDGTSTRSGGGHSRRSREPTNRSTSVTEEAVSGGTGESEEGFGRSSDGKRAVSTYTMTDPMAPARTPQVLFIPSGGKNTENKDLAVLGYSCGHDGFAFNFSTSPSRRKIMADFIAMNVKTRQVWYTRDDSEGIAQSINHLMPPGTETSLAMPIFDFDGQVKFAIVACWKDPLYTYSAGSIQFVETIAGSLIAAIMKEKLYQVEHAQLNFAAAASHELRTPLYQIKNTAELLRSTIFGEGAEESSADPKIPPRDLTIPGTARHELGGQLDIIEANSLSLSKILDNIIDILDIGRVSADSAGRSSTAPEGGTETSLKSSSSQLWDLAYEMENTVMAAIEHENSMRKVSGRSAFADVEVILEVLPRTRGGWMITTDPGPLLRALDKIINNACKFTDHGYIHITVQDVTRSILLPVGYDNSMRVSTVSIDIKDSGIGMAPGLFDSEILHPSAKADPFMPGTGIGLGLAQKIIQILGGTFAIQSKLGRGTRVHLEIPLHLYSKDNEADQEQLAEAAITDVANEHTLYKSYSHPRRDGIYLTGFENTSDVGTRRMSRSLVRQLNLHKCHIVEDVSLASLIVVLGYDVPEDHITDLISRARPGVELIYLDRKAGISRRSSPTRLDRATAEVPTTHLSRPLRPSVLRRVFRVPTHQPTLQETYVSDVVGGVKTYSIDQPGDPPSSFDLSAQALQDAVTQATAMTRQLSSHRTSFENPRSGDLIAPGSMSDDSDAADVDSDQDSDPDLEPSHSLQTNDLKVLVVEDNPVNRMILARTLTRISCNVAEAINGERGVVMFSSFEPSLVLLDINMPVKDGFDAAVEMRAIESRSRRSLTPRTRSKIIAVTALSSEADKRKGLECGIDEWWIKPFQPKRLQEEVMRLRSGMPLEN